MTFISGQTPNFNEYGRCLQYQGKLLSYKNTDDDFHIRAKLELNDYGRNIHIRATS